MMKAKLQQRLATAVHQTPSRTTGDKTSAIPTFLKIPMANTKIPRTI